MFQSINTNLLFTHAENEYIQAMEEVGAAGVVTLLIFGAIVWFSYFKNIYGTRDKINPAIFGLGFSLLAILVHSLSDFGQHVPSNAFLSIIFCAALISLSRHGRAKRIYVFKNVPFWLRVVMFLVVCGSCTFILVEADRARLAEKYWSRVNDIEEKLIPQKWIGSKEEYNKLITYAAKAKEYQPDNIKYQYWLNVYRWYSIVKADSLANTRDIAKDDLLAKVITEDIKSACLSCPTYGPAYVLLGQIEKFYFNDDSGAEKIKKGYYLAPCDPAVCTIAGQLDISEGNVDASFVKFEKAVKIDSSLFEGIVDLYIYELSRPELALLIAGENPGRLYYVHNILNEMQYEDMAEEAWQKLKSLAESEHLKPDVSPAMLVFLADIYRKEHDDEKALECYRRALALDYSRVDWHFNLAELLFEMNKIAEAKSEARICLRLQPQFKRAESFLAKLSTMSILEEENMQSRIDDIQR